MCSRSKHIVLRPRAGRVGSLCCWTEKTFREAKERRKVLPTKEGRKRREEKGATACGTACPRVLVSYSVSERSHYDRTALGDALLAVELCSRAQWSRNDRNETHVSFSVKKKFVVRNGNTRERLPNEIIKPCFLCVSVYKRLRDASWRAASRRAGINITKCPIIQLVDYLRL